MHKHQLRERLSVTNLSSENNLLTFRLNALVIINCVESSVHIFPDVHVCQVFSGNISVMQVCIWANTYNM